MKKILQLIALFSGMPFIFAQSPQIDGDLMLCPFTNGTASVTSTQTYDTYQWYSKYWFTADPFVAIPGATSDTFIYDWYTYDQSLFKLVVTLNGVTYESNEIQIDSYAWASLIVGSDLNQYVTSDPNNGNFILCQGASFTNSIYSPYDTNIQWYKDGVAIPGATSSTYDITEAGTYYVEAAPSFCPNNSSSNQGLPIIVEIDTNCALSTNNPLANNTVELYPNPVRSTLNFTTALNNTIKNYSILDYSGKILLNKQLETATSTVAVDISHLSEGFYILVVESEAGKSIKKIIKE